MTDKSKSPSRAAGYAGLVRDLVARDGLNCALCGHKHASIHTAQADSLDPEAPYDLPNLLLACKPCAKRRNGKPLGAYWRERLEAASGEIAHIQMMGDNRELLASLASAARADRGVPLRHVTGAQKPDGDAKPWENLPRRVRFYSSKRLHSYEKVVGGYPADVQHGDMFEDHDRKEGEMLTLLYDGVAGRWISADNAQTRGVVPDPWPPRDAEHWNL